MRRPARVPRASASPEHRAGAVWPGRSQDLKRRGDLSIMIVAHNYGRAMEICDRINLLQHGEITFNKLSKDTSVRELNDIVIDEYRRALLERQKSA